MITSFPDLVHLFDRLPAPQVNVGLGRFCAQPVVGFPSCSIGKDASGCPALLVAADNSLAGTVAPIVLECLRVIHMVNCRVQQGVGGDDERTLSIIHCTATDRAIHEYFLRSLYPIVASLPVRPSREDITRAVDRLVELFSRMLAAPRRTISGLWGELFVVANASNPSILIRSWHAFPEERFDFSSGSHRLEVKAATGTRVHHFALEQLRPATPIRVIIMSVLTERSQGGSSALDLVQKIRNRVLDPDLLLRKDAVVAETIGQDWRALQEVRFDDSLAQQSLRMIDATSIPCVAVPLPPEVSSVHFRVDLSGHEAQISQEIFAGSELFRAAIQMPA